MKHWMIIYRVIIVSIFLLLFQSVTAQETIVVGQVLDRQTGEGVANAHIYFARTEIGSSSNDEGYFLLRTSKQHPKQLVVSAIGYKKQQYTVVQGQSVGIQVELEPDNALLPEVVAIPGSNPAWALLESAQIKSRRNNVRAYNDITITMEESSYLSVSQLSSRSLSRGIWKALKSGVLTSEDSTYLVPLYVANKRVSLSGRNQEEEIIGSQGLLSSEQMESLVSSFNSVPDFYQNTILLFGKSFVSPLAVGGKRYYHYFLVDSTLTSHGKLYQIRFRPKSNGTLAFEGTLSLDSASSALQSIDVTLPSTVNINYLREMSLSQRFDVAVATPILLKSEQRALLDYAIVLDTNVRQYPSLLLERNLILQDRESVSSPTNLTPSEDYFVREQQMRTALDSLHQTPLIRFARWVAQALLTNHLNLYYVDLGRLNHVVRGNALEQVALGIPLRTSERLCPYATVGGYGIYGFRDKAWKWGAYIQAKLPTKRLHSLYIGVQDDYTRSEMNHFDLYKRENASAAGYQHYWTAVAPAVNKELKPYNFDRKRELSVVFRNEWNDNIETRLGYYGGHRHYGDPTLGYFNTPYFTYHSLLFTGRISFYERKHDIFFQRLYIPNSYPVVTLGLEGGAYKQKDNYHPYAKVHVTLKQSIGLGIAGQLKYVLEGGGVMGSVPYPLLEIMHGNQTWSSDPYKFNLMAYGEFAADRYLTLHALWNAGGLVFDRIPWVNRLNLRELVSLKAAYGGLSTRHAEVLPLPDGMKAPVTPYVEVGVGIGNILRVLNVESVWRLTNRQNTPMPLWGIRFSLSLSM